METQMKTTLKEKIKTGATLGLCMGLMGAGLIGPLSLVKKYCTPIKIETTLIPGCTIVETAGGEITYAKYTTPGGKIGEAIIPFGLERKITESLYGKHETVPATMELETKTYRVPSWMSQSRKYSYTVCVKSLEAK